MYAPPKYAFADQIPWQRMGYNPKDAAAFAYYCFLSYMEPGEAIAKFSELGWQAEFISRYEVDCYVITSQYDGRQAVLVRGSEKEAKDWLRNFRTWPHCHKKGFVHTGFFNGAREVSLLIRQALNADKPVRVAGHSQGAAIATALTLLWRDNPYFPEHIYLYGCPPIISANHCRDLEDRMKWDITRVEANLDAVPLLGLHGILGKPSRLVYIDSSHDVNPACNVAWMFWDKVWAILGQWREQGQFVEDHDIFNSYFQDLNSFVDRSYANQ